MKDLMDGNLFRLGNRLEINLSLNFKEQKKALGKNLFSTTSSFGRGFPEILIYGDRYNTEEWKFEEKDHNDIKYYIIVYEYNLSKVRTIEAYNQFDQTITLFQRHGFWSFMK